MPQDSRSAEAQEYRRWYRDPRWRGKNGIRAQQLAKQPLCEMCLKAGRITAATVCDHINPKSKRTEAGFFAGPFQSLCDVDPWRCHSSTKQRQESRGYIVGCDAKGRPTDPQHPWNRAIS